MEGFEPSSDVTGLASLLEFVTLDETEALERALAPSALDEDFGPVVDLELQKSLRAPKIENQIKSS